MKIKFTKIPIYERRFTICNNREEACEIVEKYLNYKPELDKNTMGWLYRLGDGKYLLSCFDGTINTLNHEITHLALNCLNNGDNYDFREQQEALSYLVGYLTEIIYKELNLPIKFTKS